MSDEDEKLEEGNEDETEGVEGEEGEDGEGDKKRMMVIIGGAVLLLFGVGAGLFFSGMLDGLLGKKEVAEEHSGEHGESPEDGKGDGVDKDKNKKGKDGKSKDGKGKDDKGKDGKGKEKGAGNFMPIPTMNISLNSDGGPPRFLRLAVQLELYDPADAAAVEAIMPRVIDKFQTYLRELRVKDLRGSGGIYRLQMELLWRVNLAAAPVEVKDVLFQEILIQ